MTDGPRGRNNNYCDNHHPYHTVQGGGSGSKKRPLDDSNDFIRLLSVGGDFQLSPIQIRWSKGERVGHLNLESVDFDKDALAYVSVAHVCARMYARSIAQCMGLEVNPDAIGEANESLS